MDDDLVVALMCFAGFVAVVGLLAAKNAHRTNGRACCAPADPSQDLRMRTTDDAQLAPTKHG